MYNQKSCTLGLVTLFHLFKVPVQRQLGIIHSDVVSKLLQSGRGSPPQWLKFREVADSRMIMPDLFFKVSLKWTMSAVPLRYVQGIVKVLASDGDAIKKVAHVQVNGRYTRL